MLRLGLASLAHNDTFASQSYDDGWHKLDQDMEGSLGFADWLNLLSGDDLRFTFIHA